jgi:hypothetical protein
MEIREYLIGQALHINNSFENDLVYLFCATGNNDRRKRVLGNWMEGYLYCASLGIVKNYRVPFKGKEKQQKAIWSATYIRQYEYLIAHLMTKKDILVEIGLLSPMIGNIEEETKLILLDGYISDGQFNKEIFYKKIFDQLKNICDEYMNGGLNFLAEKRDEGYSFTDETESLVNLLKKN